MIDLVRANPSMQEPFDEAPFHVWNTVEEVPWLEFYRADEDFLLRFPDLADFHVSADGRRVVGTPVAGVGEGTINQLFLNQIMPLALNARGKLAIHASAVVVSGEAIAFAGVSGSGKSTLAASFAANGYPFLTEDVLILEQSGQLYVVVPGHPSIRLWEDSEQHLIDPGTEIIFGADYTPKARYHAGGGLQHCDRHVPLRAVYFLGSSNVEDIDIAPLNPAAVLVDIIKQSFHLDIEDKNSMKRHFKRVAALCDTIPGYCLDYPRRYKDLTIVRNAIVAHDAKVRKTDET